MVREPLRFGVIFVAAILPYSKERGEVQRAFCEVCSGTRSNWSDTGQPHSLPPCKAMILMEWRFRSVVLETDIQSRGMAS